MTLHLQAPGEAWHRGRARRRPDAVRSGDLALVTGLPPGSFFVDVDRERGVALIHVLDASDPEAFREQQEDFYRQYQSKVFPVRRSRCTR